MIDVVDLDKLKAVAQQLRDADEQLKPYMVMEHPGVILKLVAEIEQLQAENQVMINDPDSYLHRMYLTCRNKTFLDAAKMAEEWGGEYSRGAEVKREIAALLRRAAEGVKP